MIKKYPQWFFLILGYEQSKNLPALWKFSRRQKRAFLYKKQQMWCRNCDRQWLIDPIRQPINREKKEQVISLLKERLSLSGICRVCKISMGLLFWFLQTPGKCLDYQVHLPDETAEITLEPDEMWTFVGNKKINFGFGSL